MEKSYSGKPPTGDEWEQIGGCIVNDEAWQVWRKEQAHTPDWGTYKICAIGKAKRKANYWFVRNDSTGQIGFAKDFAIMRETRPELHQTIESLLKHQSGNKR